VAESKGVYFGSKDDKVSSPADLAAAEKAASKYVSVVDFDKAGYVKVDPKLGPIGLASWGTREFNIAKPWAEADYRVHVARGPSTHILAGWTGSVKGLIGLHAFGLRPTDQGMDKRGMSMLDSFPLMTQASGFMAALQLRSGIGDLAAKIAAEGNPELKGLLKEVEGRWAGLRNRGDTWATFSKEIAALTSELKKDQANGVSPQAVADKMRWRTREILDRADAKSPGFKQAMWDASADGTRFFMKAAQHFRFLIPSEMKDQDNGMRIGLLTQLPYQSDLVIKTQPKIGEGGGPDAYTSVKDVGAIIAGTDEASTDVMAWKAAGKSENVWSVNFPLHAGLVYGRGPMHLDEIKEL
jgi:hypothetical protein